MFCRWFILLLLLSAIPVQADTNLGLLRKVRIGVILPLSGEFAMFGELVRSGIESVKQPHIELIFEDDACEAARAVSAFRKLSDFDGVKLIIGPACASSQKVLAPLIRNSDKLLMLPISGSESLNELSGGKIFSPQYSIEQESAFIAQEIHQRGFKRAVVICQEHEFCEWHNRAFEKSFKGKIVRSLRYPKFDLSLVRAAALQLKNLDFDVIYLPDASPLLAGFPKELDRIGVKRPMYAVYSAQLPEVISVNGRLVEGLLYSYPDVGDTDAVQYFPRLAAQIFFANAITCGGDSKCVYERLLKSPEFNGARSRSTEIVLRTIKDGKFTLVESKVLNQRR